MWTVFVCMDMILSIQSKITNTNVIYLVLDIRPLLVVEKVICIILMCWVVIYISWQPYQTCPMLHVYLSG